MASNYDVLVEDWRKRFLTMDCASLADRFGLRMDNDNLYVVYFSREYAVSRADGRISRTGRPEEKIGFDTSMTIYNMFHYAVERPAPSGKLVPFRSVRRVYPFEKAYQSQTIAPFAQTFTHRPEALQRALNALHARPIPQGDAGGILEILPGLCLSVTFWDADDEFPAQATLLFDYNITDYMHEENVVLVAGSAIRFLMEEAGLTASDR